MSETRDGTSSRLILNAGSGLAGAQGVAAFFDASWHEVRLDVDAKVRPDILGSITDLHTHFAPATFDAIWSSHSLEHLHAHEVVPALQEFRFVLKQDGFAVVTCPDLEAVGRALVQFGLDHKAYDSPAGPILVHDMIFGHSPSIADGFTYMAHKTGFTQERLGSVATQAGFAEVHVACGTDYDLWGLLLMSPQAKARAQRTFAGTKLAAVLEL